MGNPTRNRGQAKPIRAQLDLPTWETPGSHGLPPNAGTRPGTDGFAFDLPTPAYPGLDRQPPGSGTQPVPNYTQTGNQPGFVRQADPNISGVGQTTTGFRDAAGEQPLPTRTIAEGKGIQLVLVNRGPTDRFGDTCSWRWRH